MNLLGAALYDPSSAGTKATTSLLAMTAVDTTNLRLTVTVPAHGLLTVRMMCAIEGATTFPQILLGVMVGAAVKGRVSPAVTINGTALATTRAVAYAEFTITGLAAGSTVFDAAYGVELIVASTNIKYGGPDNTTGDDAWGAFVFELWDPRPLPTVIAGGAGGLLISGANTGPMSISGGTSFTNSGGDALTITSSGSNGNGMNVSANGTGAGILLTPGATGHGLQAKGGATSGDAINAAAITSGHGITATGVGTTKHGVNATGGSTTSHGISATGGGVGHGILATSGGGATGDGIRATAASSNGNGLNLLGVGTGAGTLTTGGATGIGFSIVGGGTSGDGLKIVTTSGHGINSAPVGTSMHGFLSTGGNGGTSDGIKAAAGTGGVDFRANQTGNLTGNVTGSVASVTGQLTAAQIATGVWQDATAGDFTTASSIGKSLYTSGVVPGGSGGLFISGSNSGTTTFAALTVTGATTLTGNVSMAAGLTISQSTTNGHGITTTGNGTGQGLRVVSGGSTSEAMLLVGGSVGLSITSAAGDGIKVAATAGHGIVVTANGTSKHGLSLTGGTAGTSDGFSSVAGTGGVDIRGNITGNLVGTVSTLTTYTGNTVQTGDSYARIGAAGVSLTAVGLTGTQTFSNTGTWTGNVVGTVSTVTTVTNQLTAAAIATGVWQDATAGDFTTASSIGKALYIANVAPGAAGGHFIAGTNAATTITTGLTTTFTGNLTGNVGGNVTGSIGSIAAGGIAAASFAAGAIDAAAIATDAIGSAEIAASATAEIADRVWNALNTGPSGGGGWGIGSFGEYVPANLDTPVSSRLAPTVATRTLDVSAAGEAGIDFANIGSPTTTVALSGTTIGTLTTYTGNTVQTGDSFARIGANGASLTSLASAANLATVAGYIDTEIGDIQSRLPAALVGGKIDATVSGAVGSVTGAVGSVTGNVGGNVAGSIGSLGATAKADVEAQVENGVAALLSFNGGGDLIVGEIMAGGITAASFAPGVIDTVAAIRSNTAQAGAAGSVTLDASASAVSNFYRGLLITISSGTGAGQVRRITAYNGTSKVATVTPAWVTNPDATSVFSLIPSSGLSDGYQG